MNTNRTPLPFAAWRYADQQPNAFQFNERAELDGLDVQDSTWDDWLQVQRGMQAARSLADGQADKPAQIRASSVQ